MELIDWAKGNGQTLQLSKEEAEVLIHALIEAIRVGKGNAVLENTEINVEIV